MVKIFTWNCRGISNTRSMDYIKDIMARLKPDFICLVETKSNSIRIQRFCARFSRHWVWAAVPSNGYSGGIIVLWKRFNGIVTPVASSRMALHLIITTSEDSWILSTIYNSQVLSEHKNLWKSLSGLSQLDSPWLLTGDFNDIMFEEEHKGGSFRNYSSKSKAFTTFIQSNNLLDLGFTGSCFTWCNGHDGLTRRWARLDRFLSNSNWFIKFNYISSQHHDRINFDHTPMFLTAHDSPSPFSKIFRFENI